MPSSPRAETMSVAPNSRPRSVRCVVAAHEDDLLSAQALGRKHRHQADRTVADHGDAGALVDAAHDGGVVAGAEDVGQRQ